ncbi:MAG: hypothetical protein K2O12_06430 [Muribaculaceae bacterium]|nr:hypothetical protein [Muribaculaceae bacterium]
MAKAIKVDIKFDSNGKAVFANLRGDADGLAKTLAGLQGPTVNVTSTLIKNYGLEWDAAAEIQDVRQMAVKFRM